MRTSDKIQVINANLIAEDKVHGLTLLQQWICAIFKIEPRLRFHQEFNLLLAFPYWGSVGDILIFEDTSDKWQVSSIHNRRITVATVGNRDYPRTEADFRRMRGVAIQSMYAERSSSTTDV